jgi:hypothetical protein
VVYVLLLARRGAEPVGLCVLNPAHEVVPDSCTIADWLVPAGDEQVAEELLRRATRIARQRGRGNLMAVAAEPFGFHAHLRNAGFRPRPSEDYMIRRLGCRTFAPRFTSDWLRRNWYYTLGDSDLV